MTIGAGALRSRRCARRWMLKRVPDWGVEWARWFGLLGNSATGYPSVRAISLAPGTAGQEIDGASPVRVGRGGIRDGMLGEVLVMTMVIMIVATVVVASASRMPPHNRVGDGAPTLYVAFQPD